MMEMCGRAAETPAGRAGGLPVDGAFDGRNGAPTVGRAVINPGDHLPAAGVFYLEGDECKRVGTVAAPSDRPALYYRARHDPSEGSVALFDRVEPDVQIQPDGSLLTDADLLAQLLGRYRVGLIG